MIKKDDRICLAMMVKNNADVIEKSLESARSFIDYYIICDLNSGDDSIKIIEKFFQKYSIKGEIYKLKEDEVSNNMGHNRTLCMKLARGKGDYLLLIDPNERLIYSDNLEFSKLENPIYRILVKNNSGNFQHYDYRILKGEHCWEYKGVVYEYLIGDMVKDDENIGKIKSGKIFIEAITNKREINDYKKDALLLEKEILDESDNIKCAYALAESYKSCYEYDNAIKNYERMLKIGGNAEEMFYAKYEIGICKMMKGDRFENFVGDLLVAYNNRPRRLEPVYKIVRYCRMNDMSHLAWHLFKHILDEQFDISEEELNLEEDIYNYKLLDELSIAAQYVEKYSEAKEIIEKMLERGKYNKKEEKRIIKNLEEIKKKLKKVGNGEKKEERKGGEVYGEEVTKNEEIKEVETKIDEEVEKGGKRLEEIFEEKIKSNEWGYKNQRYEISTGYGNTEETTVEYRKLLKRVIDSNKVRHVIDVGCGIWEFEHKEFDNIIYIGVDCVGRVIEFNKERYNKKNRFFVHADVLDEKNNIPEVDLCILKDVLQHLSHRNIIKILDKVIKRVKYIIIVQDHQSEGEILDIDDGEYRPLSIYQEPLIKYHPRLIGKYWTKDISIIGRDLSKFRIVINRGTDDYERRSEIDTWKLPSYEEDMERNIKMVVEKGDKREEDKRDPKILLAILARNKGHVLEKYLGCIENLNYDKKRIVIYINTNNNSDNTLEILDKWVMRNREKYFGIEYEKHEKEEMSEISSRPHDWNGKRFKVLGEIRNKSLRKTKELSCEYYFVVDCDNFLIPETLKELIEEDKPIIAPMLRAIPEANDSYSNFFCATTPNGYYKYHPDYMQILKREILGTFEVPVVHCTYLIKGEYLDKLNYIDNTQHHEFVIFSRFARNNKVGQYICNKSKYGECVHFYDENISLEGEKMKLHDYYNTKV